MVSSTGESLVLSWNTSHGCSSSRPKMPTPGVTYKFSVSDRVLASLLPFLLASLAWPSANVFTVRRSSTCCNSYNNWSSSCSNRLPQTSSSEMCPGSESQFLDHQFGRSPQAWNIRHPPHQNFSS